MNDTDQTDQAEPLEPAVADCCAPGRGAFLAQTPTPAGQVTGR